MQRLSYLFHPAIFSRIPSKLTLCEILLALLWTFSELFLWVRAERVSPSVISVNPFRVCALTHFLSASIPPHLLHRPSNGTFHRVRHWRTPFFFFFLTRLRTTERSVRGEGISLNGPAGAESAEGCLQCEGKDGKSKTDSHVHFYSSCYKPSLLLLACFSKAMKGGLVWQIVQ